jgi:hypothetical protein
MLTTIRPLPISEWTVGPRAPATGGGDPAGSAAAFLASFPDATIRGLASRNVAELSTRLSTDPQIMFANSQTTSPISCSDRSGSSAARKSAATDRAALALTLSVSAPEGSPSNVRCATNWGSGWDSGGSPKEWMKNIFSITSSVDS